MIRNEVRKIVGLALCLRGNDIDTDQLVPSRFLKGLTFSGLGEHLLEDARAQARARGELHPLDNPAFDRASLLFVNDNFGCGSSREHAVHALAGWGSGIRAVVGESFSNIFAENCLSCGIPAVSARREDVQLLMQLNEAAPETEFTLDLDALTLSCGSLSVRTTMPKGARERLLTGEWDDTTRLLSAEADIQAIARRLEYFHDWSERVTE